MTSLRVRFAEAARSDVRDAFEWYLTRSPRAARRFLAEVDRATAFIREAPRVWPAFELDTRRYLLHGFPYSLIFRESEDLVVVAVAHHKRRPGFWHSRPDA